MPIEPPRTATSLLALVMREPTVHFTLVAVILFVAGAIFRSSPAQTEIEIDRADVLTRIQLIEEDGGVSLTAEQRQQVEDDFIDEQVLVREALALGLEDDPRIHDFLAQKMLHVLSADVIQPSEPELAAYYERSRARYASEPTVVVEEVVIGSDDPLPPGLVAQLTEGRPAAALVTDLPLRVGLLSDVTARDLGDIFGSDFGGPAFGAPIGTWTGPHHTVRGQHWLRVTQRSPSAVPPLSAVRGQVRLDWIAEQEEIRLRARVAELRARYSITVTGPAGGPEPDS